jgi:hypothetical protein
MSERKRIPRGERLLSGTLSAYLSAVATTMTVSTPPSASKLPTYIEIDPDNTGSRETVRVIDVAGYVCTIERGVYDGGTGQEHQSSTPYKQKITQKHWDAVADAVETGYLTEDSSHSLSRTSATVFTITTNGVDLTAYYTKGRILRFNGADANIAIVQSATYLSNVTTVTVSGGVVPNPLTSVAIGISPRGAQLLESLYQIQSAASQYAADTGSADTYAIALTPKLLAYTTGMPITFKAANANTGASTLNVDSLGATEIKKNHDQALAAGDIEAGQLVTVIYDGTNFQMQSQVATTAGASFSQSDIKPPQGYLLNGKLSITVASNNITVAVKTLAGSDPSAGSPVHVRIGDTVRSITAALSVTKNAGTNWFNAGSAELATKEIDYFAYLGYNATDGVVLGFARIPWATQYSSFSTTTTDEKYCAISTITTAAGTDYYELIGRFAATLSAGAGYTWSVPTFTAENLIQRPIYETRVLTSVSVLTGFSSSTYTGLYYQLKNRFMSICPSSGEGIGGTSNATNFIFSLPMKLKVSQYGFDYFSPKDNGGNQTTPGNFESTAGSNTIVAYKSFYNTAWTNTNGKQAYFGWKHWQVQD